MSKLRWPPTAYGISLYEMLVGLVKAGNLTGEQAQAYMDSWFDLPDKEAHPDDA